MLNRDRCIEGSLYRYIPQPDDPDFAHYVGPCPDCEGRGCESSGAVDPDLQRLARENFGLPKLDQPAPLSAEPSDDYIQF